MRQTPFALSTLLALGGCSFIDDFDFDVADGSVGTDASPHDGGRTTDAEVAPDGAVALDAGGPTECVEPCLGDAVDDFATTQEAGVLRWTYLRDERDPVGLAYSVLTAGTRHGAPAWTDGSPPPAIVNCADSVEGGCASAGGRLLFEADQPGDGSDPVLAFIAPADGTYAVVAEVASVEGLPALSISRTSRWDLVADAAFEGPGSLTETVDLLAGERTLVRVSPAAIPGGLASLATGLRVSRQVGAAPLADCLFAATFDGSNPFELGCTTTTLAEVGSAGAGSDETGPTAGPSAAHGSARDFPENAALEADGLRMDYTQAFTVQLWLRIDDLDPGDPFVFSDLVAADPTNSGGVNLVVRRGTGMDHEFEAQYAFPSVADPPPDSGVTCADSCRGSIRAPMPPMGEWHFFRLVRRTDTDEVRLCIDGELVGSGWLDRDLAMPSPGDVKLGTSGVSSPRLDGAIDDVRVFSRALPCGD